ncbi:MAG TPA: FtsX-like permease family protein [Lacibacter sp.]|nr:FtsX-like permease family protein [Lacibacter sp.]
MMILLMAWRNIWRNKMRSIIIMMSVALGLFAGIAILALYKGMMHSRVRTLIDAEAGHFQLHHVNFKNDYESKFVMARGDSLLQQIRSLPGVKLAAKRSITQGMLATATGSAGVQINGVVPEDEYMASQLKAKIIDGDVFDSSRKNEIMIGKKLAKKMKLKTGSKLVLTFTDSSGAIVSSAFRVKAIYESNNAPLDERNVYILIHTLNELLGIGNNFHEIVVLLHNDEDVPLLYQQLQQQFSSCQIESWKELSPESELMVKTVDVYSYIIMVIIMFALAFGIVNTMLMAILERTKEIGMMVALGTGKASLFVLVLSETIFLTLAGTPFGLLASWLITGYYSKHGLDLSGMGREMMSSFGYSTLIYPSFPTDKIVGVILIVFCTALLSCLFPAVKALKLKPVEALRR